jgi:L-lactate dehydrogenase (cytochrome)
MVGRPWVYALAARQKAGVSEVLNLFGNEMRVAMALSGCTKIADINRSMVDLSN